MKKLSRKLSRKEGGFFKGSHESEERDPVKEESLEVADSKVTIKVTSSEKPKRVQRSVTIDHTNSESPANISRRKFSEKRTLTLPPTGQLCRICYGEFTQPKQLPCGHTFCQNCLQKFVNPKLMVECPTCREETQLSLLGVSSLPDNHEVTSMRQRTPEIINHGPGGQDKVGQCLSLQDNTSMRRQLQTSFSNMEDFEAEFRNEVQELSKTIQNTIEKKMKELTKKKGVLEEQLKNILEEKLESNERWRSESEDMIRKLGEESSTPQGSLSHSYETLLNRLEKMSREKLNFDTDSLTLTLDYKKSNELEIATATRKPSWNKPQGLSEEFYKLASLEEVKKLKWKACLQPRCAVQCPWTGHVWVCSSGSREIAIFDSDDNFVHSFTNSAFLLPCSVAFNTETMEAYVLGM